MPSPVYAPYLHLLNRLLPVLAIIIAGGVGFSLVISLALTLFNWRHQLKQPSDYLELTPPAFNDRALLATEQLFSVLHALGMSRSRRDKLLLHRSRLSLEIVATKSTGIRYLIRVARQQTATVEQTIHAYLPEVRLCRVDDYLRQLDAKQIKVAAFRQTRCFAYPLASYRQLDQYDPAAYLTGAMTKLNDGDLVAWQFIIQPRHVRQAAILSDQILQNADLWPTLKGHYRFGQSLTTAINQGLLGIIDLLSAASNGASRLDYRHNNEERQIAQHKQPVRTIGVFEQQLIDSINQKLARPLFQTDIRVLISTPTKLGAAQRLNSLTAAIGMFNVPNYQQLKTARLDFGWIAAYRRWAYFNRWSTVLTTANLLSVAEIAGFYHFPNSLTAKTDNVIKSLSRTLPAPISLKNGQPLDILLGLNDHHGLLTPIGLTAAERQRHVYIIGGTGSGKTTMLLYAIIQDIAAGKGVAVLDPHGDLAETILKHIPKERLNDVIYLNPDDVDYPIGINLLELPADATGNELKKAKDLVTESTISVMRKIFSSDDSGGHRVEYVLRNTVQTALTVEGATLFTIFRLLNDNKYRRSVTYQLADEDLKNFWNNELDQAGSFQKVKMTAGITAKIGRFLFSAAAKRILEQPKSTIDFDDILNSGKILICNFSKGLLGEDTSTLFGTTILAKLQMASLRRARQKQTERQACYLYVDEFQNFATMSFVQMLSEARKYKLFLTMAEQSTAQQEQQRLVDIILANVGTVVCFRSGSPADERFVLPLFAPFINSGEIAYLPAYNFYIRIAAVNAQEPLSGLTVLADEGDAATAALVIEASRLNYATAATQPTDEAIPQIDASNTKSKRQITSKTRKTDKVTRPIYDYK